MNERQNGCDESRRHETELEIETMKALFSQKSAEYEASLSTLEQNLQFHMNEKFALNSSNVAFQALANEKTKLALTLQNQLTEQLFTSQSLQKSLDLLQGQLEQNNSEIAAKCSDLEDKNLQLR